ncbi:hypothetical protein TIFTF001_026898 [Ficus carica]|uniref:Cytochrome P450 n=1 Tax=Ficus carica TaxID=3494 RepID=A0AA88DMB7_FICCA|nr:hypothetical protein TIFTF001_026898 [Ficus carica]
MEVSVLKLSAIVLAIVITTWAWRVMNWVWLRPKRLEKCLREQGLKGNSYRIFSGDLKESTLMTKEAASKPINLSDDITTRVSPFLLQTVKNYGEDSFIWNGPTPRVIITDPELVKDVFNKIDDFPKPHTNPLVLFLTAGLAEYEGEKWVKHRKIISPAFHMEKVKHMLPAFYQSCVEMLDKWERSVDHEGRCELDIWPWLENMTGDVISRTAFGSSYEDGRRIFQLEKEQENLVLKAIQTVYIPGWRYVPTKMNKRMKEIDYEIKSLVKNIILKREKAMREGEAPKDDLLGILMESNFREIREHGNNKNMGMSIEDVTEECKLFYFVGQETTSVLLTWTMVLLSRFSDWQVRAREEVLQIFGNNNPDFDGLVHLKIVTMILNEVLRLYPPIVLFVRTVEKQTQLGNLSLPPGVQVCLPTILIHHDTKLWGEDAKEFNPERFAEGVSKVTKGQVSFFPFGWGPRICIGQNFTMTQAKMAMALILQRFTFELSPSYAHAPFNIITLQPQYGAHLVVHKR